MTSKVIVGVTLSPDRFVNDRHGGVDRLYADLAALVVVGGRASRNSS